MFFISINSIFLFRNSFDPFYILEYTVNLNPLMFSLDNSINNSFAYIDNSRWGVIYREFNLTITVGWLIISALLSLWALSLFNKRKVEIAEIAGTNKVVNFIGTFIPVFFSLSMIFWITSPYFNLGYTLIMTIATGACFYVLSKMVLGQSPFRQNNL